MNKLFHIFSCGAFESGVHPTQTLLIHAIRIAGAQETHVASGYCVGQHSSVPSLCVQEAVSVF